MNRNVWLEMFSNWGGDADEARALVMAAEPLLAQGGEVAQTLAWHERVAEAKEANFGGQPFRKRVRLSMQLITEETEELWQELDTIEEYEALSEVPDALMAAAAKEAADVLFVVLQAMHTLGVPFEAVYAEVMRSNASKLQGGVRFRPDGKLLKGDAYSPADVEGVLLRGDTSAD